MLILTSVHHVKWCLLLPAGWDVHQGFGPAQYCDGAGVNSLREVFPIALRVPALSSDSQR